MATIITMHSTKAAAASILSLVVSSVIWDPFVFVKSFLLLICCLLKEPGAVLALGLSQVVLMFVNEPLDQGILANDGQDDEYCKRVHQMRLSKLLTWLARQSVLPRGVSMPRLVSSAAMSRRVLAAQRLMMSRTTGPTRWA